MNTQQKAMSNTKTYSAADDSISGNRKGLFALLPFIGPAFVASIAYLDPGNYATNISGGAQFGFKLLWVIVIANIMGILFQNMSAKLGIATGKNLPELCRETFPKKSAIIMWILSELASMATELAEFLGATLALNLLFDIPMIIAVIINGIITYVIVAMERYGFRPLEKIITAFALLIGLCYIVEMFYAKPPIDQVAYHSVVPWIGNSQSIMLAVGIIGATIMPHAVFLHSSLTQKRVVPKNDAQKLKLQKYSTIEIFLAMGLAGVVNLAMMVMAASVFYESGHTAVGSIETAYVTLIPLLGHAAASVFIVSLLVSGVSSSVVGTMAGQVIMQGFVNFTIPVWLRRVITMVPAAIVVTLGLDPTQTLVVSQVILSIVLPLPLILLIHFTRKKELMGNLVNKKTTTVFACIFAAVILTLNIVLIVDVISSILS
ncbi:manganese transport protein [Bacillus sp. OV322]|uniref:Nramp family divalent metal transporter n=1 Tax=Bacillus sp. OV322 TaxID=1882764 RepID=UPI0008E6908F|nr:Nramp family divalent metal transporter [Bacillus sp. OV322]SFC88180.1 manganese transport protein [Bacillus sp. OV322]